MDSPTHQTAGAAGRPGRVLFVFLDGVGVGERDAARNPFARAALPHLRGLLGGDLPFRGEAGALATRAGWVAADATLGVPGRPQSGTGQTTLLTGENAPRLFGRHFGSWVPTPLRPLLQAESLLARAVAAGRAVCFANAYPLRFLPSLTQRRPAAPPLAAHAAGLLWRDAAELRVGRAVASSITHERWRERFGAGVVPEVAPEQAGRVLAGLAAEHRLTFFAHYDTDAAGHRQELGAAVAALEKVDRFLGGVLAALPADTLLVLASDHGNLEDVAAGHTLNPVPVIAAGPGSAELLGRVRDLTHLAPALLELVNPHD